MIDDMAVYYLIHKDIQVYCMTQSSYDKFTKKLKRSGVISLSEYHNVYEGKYDQNKLHIFVSESDIVWMNNHFKDMPTIIYDIVPNYSIIVNGSALKIYNHNTGIYYIDNEASSVLEDNNSISSPNHNLFLASYVGNTIKSLGVVGDPTNISTFSNQSLSVGDIVSVLVADSTYVDRVVCKDEQGHNFIKGLESANYDMAIVNGVYQNGSSSKFIITGITKSWKKLSCDTVISNGSLDKVVVSRILKLDPMEGQVEGGDNNE